MEEYNVYCPKCKELNCYLPDYEDEEFPVHCVGCGKEFISINGRAIKGELNENI